MNRNLIVNSLVQILYNYNPKQLERFCKIYPEHEAWFVPGRILGNFDVNIKAMTQLALLSIEEIESRVMSLISKSYKQVKGNKLYLVFNSIAIFLGSILLWFILVSDIRYQVSFIFSILLVITISSAICLYINVRDIQKNPQDILENLMRIRENSLILKQELRESLYNLDVQKDPLNLVRKSNLLASEFLMCQIRLGDLSGIQKSSIDQ